MRAALVAVVLSLAVPGAAAAQSFSVPAHLRKPISPTNRGVASAGPALAGDRVLWWETRAGTAVLVSARAGEAPRDLVALPPVPTRGIRATFLAVAASEVTAIAERITADCPRSGGDCRVIAGQRLKVDPATGAATPFDTCLGAPACVRCQAQGSVTFFDLAGSVFSEADGCRTGGGVLDFADGATRRLGGGAAAAAGRYAIVATGRSADERVDLVDWRTGARLRTLSDILGLNRDREVSVAEDGTVAWVGVDASVIPPGAKDPIRVPFPLVPGAVVVDQVRLGGGLLALRRVTEGDVGQDSNTFQITRPDGSERRILDGQRVGGGWAFDGRRLAWATQPCGQFVIQVWDVAGAPPPDAPERCAVPAIDTRPIRMRDSRHLPVTLTCPPTPARGCAGFLGADLQRPGSHRRVVSTFLQIHRMPAGSTQTVRLALTKRGRLRGLHRLRAEIAFEAFGGGGSTAGHASVTRR